MNTDLEITLEFLDSPTEVEFYAVAGAPGQDGADGADGHTPVIAATKSGNTTTISVDGNPVAQILDGADGQPGQDGQDGSPGQDGADGHSPVVTASKSGKVTTVSVDGSPIATINDGEDGQDGQDGSDGQDGQDGYTPIRGTDYWTAEDKAEIVAEAAGAVNIPAVASGAQVKGGSASSVFVAPSVEDAASFYGLAKAAGDSTQSASSNTVGNYTEEAKAAIRAMLGIPNYIGELLYDETTTEDLTELIVNTDLSGQPFEVMKLIAIFTAPQSTTGTRDSFYGSAYVNLPNGTNNAATAFPSMLYPTATSTMMARVTLTVYPNMPLEATVTAGTSGGNTQNAQQMPKDIIAKSITGIRIYQSGSTKSLIPAGSRLRVYGIRA